MLWRGIVERMGEWVPYFLAIVSARPAPLSGVAQDGVYLVMGVLLESLSHGRAMRL